jgi:hypothetical protein
VSFSREVLPLLSDNCLSCHGQDAGHRKADLRLDTPEGAREVLKSGDFIERITARPVTIPRRSCRRRSLTNRSSKPSK